MTGMVRRLCRSVVIAVVVAIVAGNPPAAGAVELGISEDVQYLSGQALGARLDNYVRLGVRWVRFQLQWAYVEPSPGSYDPAWVAGYDALMSAISKRGLKAIVEIQTTPPWARGAGCSGVLCAPADVSAYAAFAGAVAKRYAGRVGAWEIWNEPNNPYFFQPAPDPRLYTQMLVAAYRRIKAADPRVTVVSGGLAPSGTVLAANGSYVWVNPVDFLSQIYAYGGARSFDAVGIHPYTFPASPLDDVPGGMWQQLDTTSPSLRSVMTANGDGAKKLWATEYGAPTGPAGDPRAVSEDEQATIITNAYAAWSAHAWAGPMILWTYQDWAANDENAHFGLVRADGTPKPAYAAVHLLASG